jgi:predicted phage tail protein
VYETVNGSGSPASGPARGLNLYKVVANSALGTGPGFVDPATLGAPGFNEFYYLRHYPDAAAAVQSGQYASGLAHYLAVGRARGYLSSASAGLPTNLTASVAGSSVTLSWTAPSNAVVTSYVLEAGSAPGQSNLVRSPTGSAATSFSTSGVPPGTYYVRVKTISGNVTTGPSNEVVVTVGPGACTAPGAPTGLASSVAGSTVSLRWSAGSGLTQSFLLEAGSVPGLANLARLDLGQPATTFTAANVPSGTYYLRVRGTNPCGTSGPSNEIVAVVPSALPAPTNLTATVAGSAVTLSWTAPPTGFVTSYLLEAGSAPGLTDLARVATGNAATSFSTSGVPAGRYYVRVKTISGTATSGPSNEVVVTVAAAVRDGAVIR